MVLGNLTTQGYAKAMVSTFGNTYFGEAVVKRSASMELRTRLVIAYLGFLSLLRRAHNPKVEGSNPSPATSKTAGFHDLLFYFLAEGHFKEPLLRTTFSDFVPQNSEITPLPSIFVGTAERS